MNMLRRTVSMLALLAAAAAGDAIAAAPAPITPERLTGDAHGDITLPCGTPQAALRPGRRVIPGASYRCDLVVERRNPASGYDVTATIRSSVPCDHAIVDLACRPDGSGIAIAGDYSGLQNTVHFLEFDRHGLATAPAHAVAVRPSCRFPNRFFLLESELRAMAECSNASGPEARLVLRRFPLGGGQESEPVILAESFEHHVAHVDAGAVDSLGNMLVAWTESYGQDDEGQPDYRVNARVLAPDASLLGEAFRVDTSLPGRGFLHAVVAEEPGIFSVYWGNFQLEGTIVRTVSIDPDLYWRAPVTTTTLPAWSAAPAFDFVRAVGPAGDHSQEIFEGRIASFTGDGHGNLYLRRLLNSRNYWYRAELPDTTEYSSATSGLRWARKEAVIPSDRYTRDSVDAASANGTLLRATIEWRGSDFGGYEIVAHRSSDAGRTWSYPSSMSAIFCGYCDEFEFYGLRLATNGNGSWMAAYLYAEQIERGDPETWEARLNVVFSDDDGASWTHAGEAWSEKVVASYDAESQTGHHLAAAAGAEGSWALAWRNMHGGNIRMARASAAGASWEVTELTAPWQRPADADPDYWYDPHVPYPGLSLVTTSSGVWIAAWEEHHGPAQYGQDGDLFTARSLDDGRTWNAPAPLNAYAAIDGARDADPSLAAASDGRVLVAWSSHDPLGETAGMDSDIVTSISLDSGLTWSPPAAVDAATATADDDQDRVPLALADADGGWTVAWTSLPVTSRWWWDDKGAVVKVAVSGLSCGNGITDDLEDCDDGNDVDGDGCNANCSLPGCGNEVTDAGESCDDGNLAGDDWCNATCQASWCGDGHRHLWNEDCDDGNASDEDECTSVCKRPYCGDGFTRQGEEQCDDGNEVETDGCRNDCELTFCGDGIVREGVEACDDGDARSGNACTNQCKVATCGDGYVYHGVEECDPADPIYAGECSPDCRRTGICSDADDSGSATATDALFILRAAVGLEYDCPAHRCDLDGSGRITASDAQSALQYAAGVRVALKCPGTGYVSFILEDTRVHGALQLDVDFSGTGMEFATNTGQAECAVRASGIMFAHAVHPGGHLSLGFVSLAGFAGPLEIARCRYFIRDEEIFGDRPLRIAVTDASGTDFETMEPLSRVSFVTH